MKLKFIALIGLLIVALYVVAQHKEYEGKMHVTPLQLDQIGDSLHIKIVFDISGVNVDSRRSISLFPVLVAPEHKQPLPEIMVKGRSNYQAYKRQMALMNKSERAIYASTAPYAVFSGYKSKNERTIEYYKIIPYEPWMEDARMDIQEDLCGCGNAPRTLAMSQLINRVQVEILLEPYQMTPMLAYVSPHVEMFKRREMVGEAFLDFVVNKIDIRADYMNNPQELKKITDMISEVENDKNISVNSISVIGYASPEGTLAGNKRLSEERAKALVGYLTPRFNYPSSLYKVEYGGENWIGLKEAVEKSNLEDKEQILNIIENTSILNVKRNISRNKSLMDLRHGESYKYLLREIYPTLRKAICKIDYNVKGLDVVEAKELMGKRPQDLSLNEMFMVANTYKNGSSEFIDIFELAVRMYPDDQTANLNAASAALARNDIRSAERYLSRIDSHSRTPEYNNAQGVLAMLKGNYDKAKQLLDIAAQTELQAAKINIEELSKKLENIDLINKQKRQKQIK